MKFRKAWLAAAVFLGCQINDFECDQACQDSWVDGGNTGEDSLAHDSLLSVRLPNPDSIALRKHVIVAAHGFTATTYEWKEFKRFVDSNGADTNVLVSLVLLGGHGTRYTDFQASHWEDWGQPILDEYRTLDSMGYTHISLAGSSTGCPLILQHVHNGAFNSVTPPKQILFIDPIVVPSAKLLAAVNLFGPILGNSPNPGSDTENAHWYANRPAEALAQLNELVNKVKNELETGFSLPIGTGCKVWKSLHDGSADPVGALLMYKGLRKSDGTRIDAELVESRLHVFTRLQARDPASLTPADSALQLKTFREFLTRVQ